jgi:hypothetical protein
MSIAPPRRSSEEGAAHSHTARFLTHSNEPACSESSYMRTICNVLPFFPRHAVCDARTVSIARLDRVGFCIVALRAVCLEPSVSRCRLVG